MQAENIFRSSERHVHLDKAYVTLVAVIFEQIANIAAEHQKTPKDVIMFGKFIMLNNCYLLGGFFPLLCPHNYIELSFLLMEYLNFL